MLREGGLGVTGCCLPEAAGDSLPAGGVCCRSKRGCSGASPSLLFPSSVIPRHCAACKYTPSKACLWGRNVAQGDRKSLALIFTHPQTPSDLTSQENPLAGQGNPLRKWKRSICAWKITKERGKLALARHFPEVCCRQVQLTRDRGGEQQRSPRCRQSTARPAACPRPRSRAGNPHKKKHRGLLVGQRRVPGLQVTFPTDPVGLGLRTRLLCTSPALRSRASPSTPLTLCPTQCHRTAPSGAIWAGGCGLARVNRGWAGRVYGTLDCSIMEMVWERSRRKPAL